MSFIFPLLILVLLVPLFLGSRRQKKAMAAARELQESLQVGDKILTSAGLHATVAGLQETTVDLEIAVGLVTRWERVVVREVLSDELPADELLDDAEDTGIDLSKN